VCAGPCAVELIIVACTRIHNGFVDITGMFTSVSFHLRALMGFGGVKLWLKRKKEANQLQSVKDSEPKDPNL